MITLLPCRACVPITAMHVEVKRVKQKIKVLSLETEHCAPQFAGLALFSPPFKSLRERKSENSGKGHSWFSRLILAPCILAAHGAVLQSSQVNQHKLGMLGAWSAVTIFRSNTQTSPSLSKVIEHQPRTADMSGRAKYY